LLFVARSDARAVWLVEDLCGGSLKVRGEPIGRKLRQVGADDRVTPRLPEDLCGRSLKVRAKPIGRKLREIGADDRVTPRLRS